MKHFLITRFNLKLEEWKTAKDGSIVLSKEWLDQRFILFENYCLPSVLNQSNANFIWLLFFDNDTSYEYRERIHELIEKYDNIRVVYTDGFSGFLPSLRQNIDDQLSEEDRFIITTRLDNDDALHKDFIKAVQDLSIEEHETVIDLSKGYQVNIAKDNYDVRIYNFSFNQFVSLVENRETYNTVLSRMHRTWATSQFIITEKTNPYWIELIHERNKVNDAKRYLPYTNGINFDEFGIKINYHRRSKLQILLLNSLEVYPIKVVRYLYSLVKRLIKN